MPKSDTYFAKGNQAAKKIKSNDLLLEAYRQYCEYIAAGKSKRGWRFEHPDLTITYRTMETYMQENPSVLDPIHIQVAETKGYDHWESLGKDMMTGKVKGAQPAIYQMFMRNKYDWDKENKVQTTHETEVRRIIKHWECDGAASS